MTSASPTFTCPEFLSMERGIIDDFVGCMRECCEETELCVRSLNSGGGAAIYPSTVPRDAFAQRQLSNGRLSAFFPTAAPR